MSAYCHPIDDIICLGNDLSRVNLLILRRTVDKHSSPDGTSKAVLDEFIRFFELNVEHKRVPPWTHEAFGHEEDNCGLAEWEHDALEVQDKLVQKLHFVRGRYKKRNR